MISIQKVTKNKRDFDKIYEGFRIETGEARGVPLVSVNNKPLDSALIHNPDGALGESFEWGYKGEKAYNLAYSILADYWGVDFPDELSTMFKEMVIRYLPFDGWAITSVMIDDWMAIVKKGLDDEKHHIKIGLDY